jgi:hypothetical protein
MTAHLSPEDFVAALERTPDGPAAAHLESCVTCRDALASLRASWHEVADVEVPEPSPLFWDHFAARVRGATGDHTPVVSPWSTRRVIWMAGTAAAALVLIAGLVWRATPDVAVMVDDGAPVAITREASVAFDDVAEVFEEMPVDEIDAFSPPGAATWAMVDDLTDDERMAFVRLIEQQMEALP